MHTQCVVLLVSYSRSQYTLLSFVAMALYRYFQASEKSGCKLHVPDPGGPLERLVPSSSIVSSNEKVQSVLESKDRTQSGRKGQRYAKLSPELKAEIGRQAPEHAATVRLYAIVRRWVWLT